MKAEERELSFIQENVLLEVPFFQRGYVWSEENWAELLDNLLDPNQSHFIGSIILKKQVGIESGAVERVMIIDGQQRLTTLSILLRACYDSLIFIGKSSEWIENQHIFMLRSLMFQMPEASGEWVTKVVHSRLDKEDYDAVVRGAWSDCYQQIRDNEDEEDKREFNSKILHCYHYYRTNLATRAPDEVLMLWQILVGSETKMLVKIDLGLDENEQAIFDTVNRTGVRLRSSDTIKNVLFQRALECLESDASQRQDIISFYSDSWETVFLCDDECLEFWQSGRFIGRLVRDNLEILLHCVAFLKGFYNPKEHRISDLPVLYKNYVNGFCVGDIKTLVNEIGSYAAIYKEHFEVFNGSSRYSFLDRRSRLNHNLIRSEIAAFDPFILKTLQGSTHEKESKLPKSILDQFSQLESYVTRHFICGISTKDFNKECLSLVRGEKTIADLWREKDEELNNQAVETATNRIRRTIEGYEINPDLRVAVVNSTEIASLPGHYPLSG